MSTCVFDLLEFLGLFLLKFNLVIERYKKFEGSQTRTG